MNRNNITNDAYDYVPDDGHLYRFYPIVVIGGGPHSLSFVSRLLCEHQSDTDTCSDPEKRIASIWRKRTGSTKKTDTLLRKQILEKCIRVFDPSGAWLSTWSSLFVNLELKFLRSPSFLHPDPYETNALRELILQHSVRTGESFGKISKLHLLPADIERFSADSASRMAENLTTEWMKTTASSSSPSTAKDSSLGIPLDSSTDIVYPRSIKKDVKSCNNDALCPCTRSHTREIGLTMNDKDRFSLPSNVLFLSCCKDLLEQQDGILDKIIEKGKITRVIPLDSEPSKPTGKEEMNSVRPRYKILLESDVNTKEYIFTNYVVVATGAQNLPIIPEWVKDTLNTVMESEDGSNGTEKRDNYSFVDTERFAVRDSMKTDEKEIRTQKSTLLINEPRGVCITGRRNILPRFYPIDYPYLLHTADIPSLFPVMWKNKLNLSNNSVVDNDGKNYLSSLRALFHNRRIVIIGGGQSACNLLQVAYAASCKSVTMVSRKKITVRNYDIDSVWMSRMRPLLRLKFYSLSPSERVMYIKKCRNGGTVQPEVYSFIRPFLKQRNGKANDASCEPTMRLTTKSDRGTTESFSPVVNVIEEDEVVQANFDKSIVTINPPGNKDTSRSLTGSMGPWLLVTRKGVEIGADMVILATGTEINVNKEPLFKDLLTGNNDTNRDSATISHGFPIPDEELRWSPKLPVDTGTVTSSSRRSSVTIDPTVSVSNIFLLGAWASIQLGPDALNMAGAITGSKILWPILRPVLDRYIDNYYASSSSLSDEKNNSSDDTHRKENGTDTRTYQSTNYSSKAQESLNRKFGGDGNLFAVLDSDDEDEL